jgi:hypothetical protein
MRFSFCGKKIVNQYLSIDNKASEVMDRGECHTRKVSIRKVTRLLSYGAAEHSPVAAAIG